MSKNLRNRILIILGVLLACLYFTFPIQKRINLGLDLKGGMHLVLKVETEKLAATAKGDAVLRAMEILRNRIDGMGVGETVIQRQGEDQIIVQLPGVTDRKKALDIVGRVAHLEFKLVNSDPVKLKEALAGNVPVGFDFKETKKDHEKILVAKDSVLQGEAISDARVDVDNMAYEPKISLHFNALGSKEFARITQEHVGDQLAIVLDDEVMSAPNIREPILTGQAEISGRFTFEEASVLALALRSGALPAPMHIEEERTIGPLLGKDSIEAGVKATIIGGILIVFFMTIYYLIGGVIASVGLVINFVMILGGMGFLSAMLPQTPMTLTLPGIAGIILTLGMAVDANVLINERIREEIESGRPLSASIDAGYARAWSAILDSHVTSLIASFMLFEFGSGPIKGFAVTLSLGLLASLFSSIYVTRTMFDWLLSAKLIKSLPMMHLFRKPNINFLNKKFICFTLSGVLIAAGVVDFIKKKEHVYGIDFAGGQIQELKFAKPVTADQLRLLLKEGKVENAVVQTFPKAPESVIIRTTEDTHEKVGDILKQGMPDNVFEVLRIEKVGPVVGQALRTKALLAIGFALLGMLIYMGMRFKHYDFAAAAVVSIFHDVLITLSLLILMGREIDLLVVTALMTITGYSINDAIIIYDRVRENVPKMKNKSLPEVINESINQTLARTVMTTFMTTLSALALYFWGGSVLNTFAVVLIRGFLFGTYSTVFILSPLFLAWHGKKKW